MEVWYQYTYPKYDMELEKKKKSIDCNYDLLKEFKEHAKDRFIKCLECISFQYIIPDDFV